MIALHTPDDIDRAVEDLAWLIEQHSEEEDPAQRAMLAEWIELDEGYLAEMIGQRALPLLLPIGSPASGPVGDAR